VTRRLAALIFAALALFAAGFHACLILGAPWGGLTMAGHWPGVLPVEGRLVSVLSAVLLALMAWTVLQRGGVLADRFPNWAIWVVVAYMALGVVANLATPVAAERNLWVPILLLQLACALRLALVRR
jgi:hypothetical protein